MLTIHFDGERSVKTRPTNGPYVSVTPSGDFIRQHAPAYGWIGNRGVLHDEYGDINKRFASKAWLTCTPSRNTNDAKRQLAEPGRYTLLRFLDEATSFAAGHRPCWTCRRLDFRRFLAAWARGNPEYADAAEVHVARVDAVLHRERIDREDRKVTFVAAVDALPDGCMVELADAEHLVLGRHLYRWSPARYTQRIPRPTGGNVQVLTPRSVVAAFRAGYVPRMHRSANSR